MEQEKLTTPVNIAFFGTSDRSKPILEALKITEDLNLVLCVTKDDVRVGRKQELRETAVKTWAKENNINFVTVTSLKNEKDKVIEQLIDSNVNLGLVADFSFMIPEEIIHTPKCGLINIHFSLLPKWRGASPVQFSILNGEEKTGITYHVLVKDMDRGDIIEQIEYNMVGNETTGELYHKLFEIAAQNLPKVIRKFINNPEDLLKQNETEATYTYSPTQPNSTFIFKDDARIDWNETYEQIERKIRAYDPWPIAWTTLEELEKGLNIRLREGKDKNLKVKVYSAKATYSGLNINEIQVEGGKRLSWEEFLNGYVES
jgi:methionyl-tRNA formyltransferase